MGKPVHRIMLRQLAVAANLIDAADMQSSFQWSNNTMLDLLEQRYSNIRDLNTDDVEDLLSDLATDNEETNVDEDELSEEEEVITKPVKTSKRRSPSRNRQRRHNAPSPQIDLTEINEKIEFIGNASDKHEEAIGTIMTMLEEISNHLVFRYNMEFAEGEGDQISALDECDWLAPFQ